MDDRKFLLNYKPESETRSYHLLSSVVNYKLTF